MFDSLLRSIPRFLLYMTLERYRSQLCVPLMNASPASNRTNDALDFEQSRVEAPSNLELWWVSFRDGLSLSMCGRILWMVQMLFCLGILALTVLQLMAAVEVRVYAMKLNLRERRRARGVLAAETRESSEGRRRDVVGIHETRYGVDEEKLIWL